MWQWDYVIDTKYPEKILSHFLSCEIRIFTKSLNDEMLTNDTAHKATGLDDTPKSPSTTITPNKSFLDQFKEIMELQAEAFR